MDSYLLKKKPRKITPALRKCLLCGKEYPATRDNFDESHGDGYHCRKCIKKQNPPMNQYEHNLKYLYGITPDQYKLFFKNQNERCGICRCTLDQIFFDKRRVNKSFDIDHDHKTKKVRGLLCGSCNMGLAVFKDNPFVLINAIKYLKKNNSKNREKKTL